MADRHDVAWPRQVGSIMAFDVKGNSDYQSARSRSLRDWFLNNGLNIRPIGPTVYLMPPYCVTDQELDRAYEGIMEGLDRLAASELSMGDKHP